MTGRGPSRFGVLTPLGADFVLPGDTITLPAALRSAGYTTHITGKWHIGSVAESRPLRFGFDSSYGSLRGQIDPYTHHYKLGDRTWHRNDVLFDEPGHATDLITDEAVRVIHSKHDKPFFLYVSYTVPHYPLSEPNEWIQLYEGKYEDPWRSLNCASITHMDEGVHRIVDALEQTGQRKNTLIVFCSDNGGQQDWDAPKSQYEGRYQPHTTLGDNRPLRGWKAQLYEGGIRVPAFLNWPDHVNADATIGSPTSILDWMPTFCHLAGCQIDRGMRLEGENIWSTIADKGTDEDTDEGSRRPRTLYWRTPSQSALRIGNWKLISGESKATVELYDLAKDPYEKQDVASEHLDRVDQMKTTLASERALDRKTIEFGVK